MKSTFEVFIFAKKILDLTFHRPPGRAHVFFRMSTPVFRKENRNLGKRSNGKVMAILKPKMHFICHLFSGICVGTMRANAHAHVCIVFGCWQKEERPCSKAGAQRLVGLRSQHIHKSGLSGSCQRLHNEGHYSGRVSKLLSQGPVPGNHTHSAPC